MTHKVRFRPDAEAHLFSLYRYIAEISGSSRAGAYIERIEKTCMSLAIFPERGTKRDDLVQGLRTIGFERRVTIAFRVIGHDVEIIAIAYAGRDFGSDVVGD